MPIDPSTDSEPTKVHTFLMQKKKVADFHRQLLKTY